MSSMTPVESIMPRSKKESLSAKLSPGLPNMKVSITNCRNSLLSAMRGHPAFKVIYKLVDQKLSGDDADQAHVVLDADGGAPAKLVQEQSDRALIEDAIVPILLRGKQFLHVLARGRLEKAAGFGGAVGLLVAFHHGWRNESGGRAFQEEFFIENFHF